jgi:hypothetical protein
VRIANSLRYLAAAAILVVCGSITGNGTEKTDLLRYRLGVRPGNLQVDRVPGPHQPRQYQETFTFTVNNPTRTDYARSAPSCKTFDVEVVLFGSSNQVPIWMWSNGQAFCQMVTSVAISAGQSWRKTVIWKFTTAEVQAGKYKAIATFEPTNNKTATVEFEITSVQ